MTLMWPSWSLRQSLRTIALMTKSSSPQRHKAAPRIRQVAEAAGKKSWIANMNREILRCQYIDSTIKTCAEFIQLVDFALSTFSTGQTKSTYNGSLKGSWCTGELLVAQGSGQERINTGD